MATEHQAEDTQWMIQAQAGDNAAFERLQARYLALVEQQVAYLVPTAEQPALIVEEIFAQVNARLHTFDASEPVSTWIDMITHEVCREHTQAAESDPQAALDRDLVRRTLAGDIEAFTRLFEHYQGPVYTHVYYRLNQAMDAQEAVQEIFHRVYTRLETFDQRKRFRAWLFTIATNYCTDVLRRRLSLKRFFQPVPLEDVDFAMSDAHANPEEQTMRNEQREQVRQALQQLPAKYREVLVLFYWNDLSYREIVEVTGLRESTIKTRLHRAREQLTNVLQQQPQEEP